MYGGEAVLETLCVATFVIGLGSLGLRGIAALWTSHRRSWMRVAPTNGQSAGLICLLPAFREQVLVSETLETFLQAAAEEPNATVVVITSLREERDRDVHAQQARAAGSSERLRLWNLCTGAATAQRDASGLDLADPESVAAAILRLPTTTEMVRTLLPALPSHRFLHFIYAGEGGGKAVHLNFALSELKNRGLGLDSDTYIGVYDFDSRPEAGSLREVAMMAAAEVPDAIVQPVLPVLGAASASRGAIADATLHVLRGLGVEQLVWWVWSRFPHGRLLWRMLFDPYFVGAGLFVRADRLWARGGFPIPVDDVPLGFAAAEEGWRVLPTRRACLTQCYPNLLAAVRSRTLVFHAYWYFITGIRRRPSRVGTGTFREAILWFAAPLALTAAASTLALQRHWVLLTTVLMTSAVVCTTAMVIGHWIARQASPHFPKMSLVSVAVAPFYSYWRALSAWRFAASRLGRRPEGVDLTSNKTPRIG